MHSVTLLLDQYGYIVLILGLFLELLAVPLPGEALMTYCGFLIFQGKLSLLPSIASATLGVILGRTLARYIGMTLGYRFFEKYGKFVHLGPEKLEKTSSWFQRYGDRLLLVSYFIPGVRHIAGYFSGITKIPYRKFALNSYIGALLWTATFISIGKVFGSKWERFHSAMRKYLIIAGIVLSIIILFVYLYRYHKERIQNHIEELLSKSIKVFHSFGRIRIIMAGIAAAFLGFFILAAGLIQDFLAKEFSEFDYVITYLVNRVFNEKWTYWMSFFKTLTAMPALIGLSVLIIIWIIIKGRNKYLEIRFLLIAVWGGKVLEEGLRLIFHRTGPVSPFEYTFPGEQSFLSMAAYGFAAYIVIRYVRSVWIKWAIFTLGLLICISSGLGPIFFLQQYPSDVSAGYVFGGVWLTLNIIIIEITRVLPLISQEHGNTL